MAAESLEQKVENLQRVVEKLQHEQERLQAVHEIQNVAAKYYNTKNKPEVFALKQPDVSVEIAMWGKFIGPEKVKQLFAAEGGHTPPPGMLIEHQLTTPYIQVAADGQTAKGVWCSPGIETYPGETDHEEGGKLTAHWCWAKYAADFIKEDGEWKVWHYHFYDTFMCPYHKSWVETPQPPLDVVWEHRGGLQPDSPPTYRSSYFPDRVREMRPAVPEPYETWDGKSVC
jgi:hypothetical protein